MHYSAACTLVLLGFAAANALRAAERAVIIVAGQSNALNWHAAAAQLPANPSDARVLFYHETGAPPERGGAAPFNATSHGKWTTLAVQHQEPYVKYERDFFGPEISLARILSLQPGKDLAVLKCAYFGTTLANDWNPTAKTGNRLYARLKEHVTGALAQLAGDRGETPRMVGFFWMQGETDGASAAYASAYAENLTAFIARVRADFGSPTLPFILGRVGPPPPKGYAYQNTVRAAQVRVAERLPFVAWVDTDDLARDGDGVHLMAEGVLTLGERMAKAWAKISNPKSRP